MQNEKFYLLSLGSGITNCFIEKAVVAERQTEIFHPLVVILSSLCVDGRNLRPSSKINLKPLKYIISSSCPASILATISGKKMESAHIWSKTVCVVGAWGGDGWIWYGSGLHSEGIHTFWQIRSGKSYQRNHNKNNLCSMRTRMKILLGVGIHTFSVIKAKANDQWTPVCMACAWHERIHFFLF